MKCLFLVLFLFPIALLAQQVKITPQDTQRKHSFLLMRDGSLLKGKVIRQDSSIITVQKNNGDFSYVEADQVQTISASRPDEIANPAEPPVTVFVLKDGTKLEGRFVRRDNTMITVRKSNNQLTYFEPELLVRVDTLRGGDVANQFAESDRGYANQFSPWLLTGQTAYAPGKGQFYYRNTLLVMNEVIYGITRNWSVGASFLTPGTNLYLTDFYAVNQFLPVYAQLFSKLSFRVADQVQLGLNVTYLDRYAFTSDRRGALTYQALISFGTSQRNVSIGAGLIDRGHIRYYFSQPVYSSTQPTYFDVKIPDQTILTLGIMQKVTPFLSLISDTQVNLGTNNYYYNDRSEQVAVSFALRLDRSRHAFDLGLYSLIYGQNNSYNGRQVRFLPYIGYNARFGKK